MTTDDIILTKVWQIDKSIVVAPTIEQAIEIYKVYNDDIDEIKKIKICGGVEQALTANVNKQEC